VVVASWRPDISFQVAFNADPNDPTAVPTWSDLTSMFMGGSSFKRGRQYELDQNQAASPTVKLLDPNELLNPANVNSPWCGQLLPYRQVLFQAQTPNGAPGNLIGNSAIDPVTENYYTPGFEPYSVGATVLWIIPVGGTSPLVTATTVFGGSRCLAWGVVGGSTSQGISWSVPCIPGRTYTSSVYVLQTAGSTLELSVVGIASPATGDAPVGGGFTPTMPDFEAGSSTTTSGAWVRLNVMFTATQPVHTIQMATTGTALSSSVRADALQHEEGALSSWSDTGPILETVFRGYVERFPRSWQHVGFMGMCEARLVDALATLNRFKVTTEVQAAIAHTKPLYWWRLGEMASATSWGDQSGNTSLLMAAWVPSYVGATARFDGGIGHGIPGDPEGLGVELVVTVPDVYHNPPAALRAQGLNIPATGSAWGMTVSTWWVGPAQNVDVADVIEVYAADQAQILSVWASPTANRLYADATEAFAGGPQAAFTSFDASDPGAHLITATLAVGGGNVTAKIYFDGTLRDTASSATSATSFVGTMAEVAGQAAVGVRSCMAGIYSHFAIWDRELSTAEIAALYDAGTGGGGEYSGQRISRYLSYGWSGETAINTGSTVMGINSLSKSTPLLAACQDVASTEFGNLWADRRGKMRFEGRAARFYRTTPFCAFGEDTAAGEYPYLSGVTYDIDPMRIVNEAKVARDGGATIRIVDEESILKFFPNTFERTINAAQDSDAGDAASWIVGTQKDPVQRIPSITLDPVGYPALWSVILRLEVGMLITVVRRPKAANGGAGLTMRENYFIEAIDHSGIDLDRGTWTTVLLLSPEWPVRVFAVDNDQTGRMALTAALRATCTSTATVLPVGTTSGPVLTTTAIHPSDFPYDLQLGNEQLTCTATYGDGVSTYRASGVGSSSTGAGPVTPGLPTGWQPGDLMVMLAAVDDTSAYPITPTGWTLLQSNGNLRGFWRLATAGDTAPSVSFAGAGVGVSCSARIMAFESASSHGFASATLINSAAANINTPSLVVPRSGVAILMGWKSDTATGLTPPAGWIAAFSGATTDHCFAAAYQILSAGTTLAAGAITVTGGSSEISRSSIVVVVEDTQSVVVTRSINGCVSAHSYGTAVDLWRPGKVGF
jgi:hypothetical protein